MTQTQAQADEKYQNGIKGFMNYAERALTAYFNAINFEGDVSEKTLKTMAGYHVLHANGVDIVSVAPEDVSKAIEFNLGGMRQIDVSAEWTKSMAAVKENDVDGAFPRRLRSAIIPHVAGVWAQQLKK